MHAHKMIFCTCPMFCDAAEQLLGHLEVKVVSGHPYFGGFVGSDDEWYILLMRKFSNGVTLYKDLQTNCCQSATGRLHCSFKIAAVRMDIFIVCSASVLPLKSCHIDLSSQEFQDGLALRYRKSNIKKPVQLNVPALLSVDGLLGSVW